MITDADIACTEPAWTWLTDVNRVLTLLGELKRHMSALPQLHGCSPTVSWHGGPQPSGLLHIHWREGDARPLAREILLRGSGQWVKEGIRWRGVHLCNFEVIIHGAEPQEQKPAELVEL